MSRNPWKLEPSERSELVSHSRPAIVDDRKLDVVPTQRKTVEPRKDAIEASQHPNARVHQASRELTSIYNQAKQVHRETPLQTSVYDKRLDELTMEAEVAGLPVESQIESRGPLKDVKVEPRAQSRFLEETSEGPDLKTNNPQEVAFIVRELMQDIPTHNEIMATRVMRDILEASQQALEINLKVGMRNQNQIATLHMWLNSQRQPMADLARSILSRH